MAQEHFKKRNCLDCNKEINPDYSKCLDCMQIDRFKKNSNFWKEACKKRRETIQQKLNDSSFW